MDRIAHPRQDSAKANFHHALKRHCAPPPLPDDDVWAFYQGLANLVRMHAGQEALKLASNEDDLYAARLAMGQTREHIEDEAETFFGRFVPGECPEVAQYRPQEPCLGDA